MLKLIIFYLDSVLIHRTPISEIPHICRLVNELRCGNFLTAVVSVCPVAEMRAKIASIGLSGSFDLLISEGSLSKADGDSAMNVFQKAAMSLGIRPEETLVITDTASEIRAAKWAGSACAAFCTPSSDVQSYELRLADILMEGFEDIDTLFLTQVWERSQKLPMTIAHTSRTILRELCMNDFEAHYRLIHEPGIASALTDPAASEEEERHKLSAYIQTVYQFYGYGLWGIFSKDSNRLIGRCGLQPFTLNGTAQTELGYYLAPDYRHKGIAYEAAAKVLLLAQEYYAMPCVYARIAPDNIASIRLAAKLGMQQVGQLQDLLLFCTESNLS
ncbi:MAG: GNAT family N-acetyltransferase [Lachnospiraceae bacterium]|nr:GNAT family N-acetyltransferase [Lachnospiraceae bacterium]